MKLNSLLFPAPESTYQLSDLEHLILIPKDKNHLLSQTNSIPCSYYPYQTASNKKSKKLLIYFHGNAEDLGTASDFLSCFRDNLRINVLGVEYPGYGFYNGKADEKSIVKDAEFVYDFFVDIIGVKPEDIIIFGRSVGTGVATELSARRKVGGLVLMSAFSSFKAVTKNLVGCFLSLFIAERFKNKERVVKVNAPVFFIHGKRDALVPVDQSLEMYEKCKERKKECEYWFANKMTHNSFNMMTDILIPVDNFLSLYEIECEESDEGIEIPWEFMDINNFGFLKPNRKTLLAKIYNRLIE